VEKNNGANPSLHLKAAAAADRLIRALNAEHALNRKRGPQEIQEFRRTRAEVDALAEHYLKALREYVQLLESIVAGEE
jgi:hypothetical protein